VRETDILSGLGSGHPQSSSWCLALSPSSLSLPFVDVHGIGRLAVDTGRRPEQCSRAASITAYNTAKIGYSGAMKSSIGSRYGILTKAELGKVLTNYS